MMEQDVGRSGSGEPSGHSDKPEPVCAVSAADAASVPNANEVLCACGKPMSRFARRCYECREQAIIDAAEKVEPSAPLALVDSDTFFHDLEDAADEYPGRWAHPCDEEPLKINPKRMAADLVDRAVEEMCEEAFEDAEGHVNGRAELEAAIEAALIAFNDAQTAYSWIPRTREVFQIPASAIEAPSGGETGTGSTEGESAVPKGDAHA